MVAPRGRGRGRGGRSNKSSSNNDSDIVIQKSDDGKREIVKKPISLSERFSKVHEKKDKPKGITKKSNDKSTRGGKSTRGKGRGEKSGKPKKAPEPKKTKEELDKELEEYMGKESTKPAEEENKGSSE